MGVLSIEQIRAALQTVKEKLDSIKSISSVVQTIKSTADSGENVITIMLSDGTPCEIKVRNGSKGSAGATGEIGARGSQWYSGTAITGTSATATVFSRSGITSALVGDYYLNTTTGNVYRCTTAGAASAAKWVYSGSIKGEAGAKGDTGATGKDGACNISYDATNKMITIS